MNTREGKNSIFMPGLIEPERDINAQFEKRRLEKEVEEANKKLVELEKQKQEELDAKMERLELLPMYDKVILLPYPRNPYRKLVENGLIVSYTGDFNNPDSGEKDTLDTLVGCAKIIEIGPLTKYLRVGDDVFYDTRTCYPVPFLKMGYKTTQENQILCVLNEGLKERFNMN